jgi:hypothetical protein
LGSWEVRGNIGHSIAVGVVGAAGSINSGWQKNLTCSNADKGGNNSLWKLERNMAYYIIIKLI